MPSQATPPHHASPSPAQARAAATPSIAPRSTAAGAWFAVCFCLASGCFSWWISLTGQPVQGGVFWLPNAVNQAIGRIVFFLGGLISFAMAVLAYRDARSGRLR